MPTRRLIQDVAWRPPVIDVQLQRRQFLWASAVGAVELALGSGPVFAEGHALEGAGRPEPFDFERLTARARAMSRTPYHRPESIGKLAALEQIDWDGYESIRFRPERALWAQRGLHFRLKFFHLGRNYLVPVRMYEVTKGLAREFLYSPLLFDFGSSGLQAKSLPNGLGFAGFQVFSDRDVTRDIAAFLGASYFRAVGREMQYGLSARGLAIDCGLDKSEEFPVFKAFWFERPEAGGGILTAYALLDSPSATGAYRFGIRPADVLLMDVDARIYLRRSVERLGIAPLTSMFQCGENDRRMGNDWRPEIHDSDGLALHTGRGEWIYRPVCNPEQPRVSAFVDENPKGFGLLQRDRNFDHYQDDGSFYDRRPSLWVQAKSDWGKGSVQLIELPTRDETSDNIVAFWCPEEPPHPGRELAFSYRLYWGAALPEQPPLARTVATRTGLGGIVGQPRRYFSWRFVVDFAGEVLAALDPRTKVEPVITASRGSVELTSARVLSSIGGYRAMFDLRPEPGDSTPVDLRLFLKAGNRALTETWMYQWTPQTPHSS